VGELKMIARKTTFRSQVVSQFSPLDSAREQFFEKPRIHAKNAWVGVRRLKMFALKSYIDSLITFHTVALKSNFSNKSLILEKSTKFF